jgi:hypothetical protein
VRIPDGVINEDRLLYFRRKAAAQSAPKATMETRVALIVAERGLTEKQMAKYFVRRRKNSKPRFDCWRFAKAQNISTDWLFDGDLRSYPRGPEPREKRPQHLPPDGEGAA